MQAGTIRSRGKTYQALWNVKTINDEGKVVWRQKSKSGFKTPGEAFMHVTKQTGGGAANASDTTVGSFLVKWLENGARKEKTQSEYASVIHNHLVPILGSIELSSLNANDINACYAKMKRSGKRNPDKGLSASTIRLAHAVLKKALKSAFEDELVASNAADRAEPPKLPEAQGEANEKRGRWSVNQFMHFLEFIQDSYLYLPTLVGGSTGRRRGEVLGLSWDDLDDSTGLLQIRRQLATSGGKRSKTSEGKLQPSRRRTLVALKTSKSARALTLDEDITLPALRVARKQWMAQSASLPHRAGVPLMFTTEEGEPLDPDKFYRDFQAAIKEAGLPRIRFHDLRHSHAQMLKELGIATREISERLGHASISFTEATYQTTNLKLARAASDGLGRAMQAARPEPAPAAAKDTRIQLFPDQAA